CVPRPCTTRSPPSRTVRQGHDISDPVERWTASRQSVGAAGLSTHGHSVTHVVRVPGSSSPLLTPVPDSCQERVLTGRQQFDDDGRACPATKRLLDGKGDRDFPALLFVCVTRDRNGVDKG
ncbi:MAG: hypothetical protein ABGZ24_11145, partial [Fuerstiella sp.]